MVKGFGILQFPYWNLHILPPRKGRSAQELRLYALRYFLDECSGKSGIFLQAVKKSVYSLLCQYLYGNLIGEYI